MHSYEWKEKEQVHGGSEGIMQGNDEYLDD